MNEWLSPWVFLQTMARMTVVWLAFYGTGKLLVKPLRIDKIFPLLPSELVGLIVLVVLTIPLSLTGIMNRTVCPLILVVLAIPGTLFTYGSLRDRLPFKKPRIVSMFLGAFMLFILLLNFANASMPNLAFDDPLITYAVQPDRWLNQGGIYWLEETGFSGFPLLYEMTAVWPASISSDRINQISVLQVFQMSMLALAVFRGLSTMRIKKNLWFPVAAIVFLTTSMFNWCAIAKTDTMAILFCTMALVSSVRQRQKDFSGSPLSSWLYMGMALATKQTAVLVLIPFCLYSAGSFFKAYSSKWRILGIISLMAIPGAFAVRTMIKTGSPTYPVNQISFLVRDDWRLVEPPENTTVNTRSSYLYEHRYFPLLKHIGIFFAYMEGNILLLIAGVLVSIAAGRWKDAAAAIPVLVYGAAAIAVFWPPWWGSKYSILVYPFIALLGARMLQSARGGALTTVLIVIPSFVIPGFFIVAGDGKAMAYRWTILESIVQGRWDTESGYRMYMSTPEGMTHMWANSALPHDSVILSLHEEKRYFFDGSVIVGWRHPLGQRLYLQNSLEEELDILDRLSVDYVGFYRNNPAVLDQEGKLEILDHIGTGDILEPVIMVNGNYLLCRYDRDRDAD